MRRLALLLLVVGALSAPIRAQAPSLFLTDSTFTGNLTRIYTVDPATGAMTLRADLGSTYTPVLAMAAADAKTLYLAGSDTTPAARCGTQRSCLLLRVELAPSSPVPLSVTIVGPIIAQGQLVDEVVGLTFDRYGLLWATSQTGSGLYVVNPQTANATTVGAVSVEVHGGDITFDDQERLWLWTNLGSSTGRYELNPFTAVATPREILPGLEFAGLASLGHGGTLYGAGPLDNRLHQIDATSGVTGFSVPLTVGGNAFDHIRGDVDSPRCEGNAACDDLDPCTLDSCTAGGCTHGNIPFAECNRVRRCLGPAGRGSGPMRVVGGDACGETVP